MTREEAISKAINIVRYFEAHFAKSKEAREDATNIIEALQQEPCENVPDLYECPCGYGWDKNKVVRHHFCPNCGRAVDGSIKTELEPCGDAVSRQAVLDLPRIKTHNVWGNVIYESVDVENVRKLPSVTPQPKVGHWVKVIEENGHAFYLCSVCKEGTDENYDWCPFCGCKMQEVEND